MNSFGIEKGMNNKEDRKGKSKDELQAGRQIQLMENGQWLSIRILNRESGKEGDTGLIN